MCATFAGPALAEAQAYFSSARKALAAKVTVAGKVSSVALDQHQYAAHGLAWLATYVESLTQLRQWAETLADQGKLTEMEGLILQLGFGEYLAQIAGGIAMSQNEVARAADLGIAPYLPGPEAQALIAAIEKRAPEQGQFLERPTRADDGLPKGETL
jgi:(2S)-methylsuccinyl-CoA dehydrogenase